MLPLPSLIIAVALLALFGAAITLALRRSRLDPQLAVLYPGLAHLSRLTLSWRYLGVSLALLAVFGSITDLTGRGLLLDPTGRGLLLAPTTAGCLVIICQSVGELISFRSARTPGIASLERRKLSSWLPGRLLIGSGITLGVWIALVAIGWHFSAADGRSWSIRLVLTHRTTGRMTYLGSLGGSPFYGWFYSVPVIWATAALLVLAGIGVLLVARRPRNGSDHTLATWDDALRRRSIRGILLALLAALSANTAIAAAGLLPYRIGPLAAPDLGLPIGSVVGPQGGLGAHWLSNDQVHWTLAILAILGAVSFCLTAGTLLGDSSPVNQQKPAASRRSVRPAQVADSCPTPSLDSHPASTAPTPTGESEGGRQ